MLTDEHVAMLRDLRVKAIYLAADGPKISDALRSAANRLSRYWTREQLNVYVLAGFFPEDTIAKAEGRCMSLWNMGLRPFLQLYRSSEQQPPWPKAWKETQRVWSNRAITRAYASQREFQG